MCVGVLRGVKVFTLPATLFLNNHKKEFSVPTVPVPVRFSVLFFLEPQGANDDQEGAKGQFELKKFYESFKPKKFGFIGKTECSFQSCR
jgi:hypothetical protein